MKEVVNIIPVESFFDIKMLNTFWPEDVARDKSFHAQLERREKTLACINEIAALLPRPDISFDDALNMNLLEECQLARLYENLGSLLESEREYGRLILYIPFEFLLGREYVFQSSELFYSWDYFRSIYMKIWCDLLCVLDVRANFLDGDVLEIDQRIGDLPRIVKAAHLIPGLVQKGMLDVSDVISLMKENQDATLKESLICATSVLYDLGLIEENELGLVMTSKLESLKSNESLGELGFAQIREALSESFVRIEEDGYGGVTERRRIWLMQVRKQKETEKISEKLQRRISESGFVEKFVLDFFREGDLREPALSSVEALIEGLGNAIEFAHSESSGEAMAMFVSHQAMILELWDSGNLQIREAVSKIFHHFYRLGIVDRNFMKDFQIFIPQLSGPFSRNLDGLRKNIDFEEVLSTISLEPELSRLIYPVFLVGGSRLKGYGRYSSDFDFAVLVRPGVTLEEASILQDLLNKILPKEISFQGITQFWLREEAGELRICDFSESDPLFAGSSWVHILFGANWTGEKEVVRELFFRLLVPYMHKTGKFSREPGIRKILLEELERDNLQYRLMHKGYEFFYPYFGGRFCTPHSDGIDGGGVFWDSGYRYLATKLFLSRVFLPVI